MSMPSHAHLNQSFQRTVKKLRFFPSAEFARLALRNDTNMTSEQETQSVAPVAPESPLVQAGDLVPAEALDSIIRGFRDYARIEESEKTRESKSRPASHLHLIGIRFI